jgi:hypothetical protein
MPTVLEHYKGSGIVYLNGIDAGTVDDVQMSGDEESATLRNPRTGVGNIASESRLSGLTLSMTFYNFNSDNLAIGLRGTVASVAATPITDEVLAVPASFTKDTLIPTEKIIDTAVAPVVTGTGGTPTRVLDTDYTVVSGGIIALAGGAMAANDEVSYTPKAGDVLEAFVNSGQEYEVIVDGINNVENDKAYRLQYYKWKPSPASDVPVISDDDFASFTLTGELTADTTKASGKSQYFKRDRVS